ncbi:glutamine synthetase/guanido kinase [Xylariaceae sp. FL0804]|nr:glutamine synthetase/guanido kinase [Xylariaceae sp. FL0804]
MAAAFEFRGLNAAVDSTPIVDHHAHPLLKAEHAGQHPLLALTSEANGAALDAAPTSLAHLRAARQLAPVLGCAPTWDAVAAAVEAKRAASPDAWAWRCLEGIETILIDDGLDRPDQAETYGWHDSFTTSRCRRVVRIEAVAEDIIARHCDVVSGEAPGVGEPADGGGDVDDDDVDDDDVDDDDDDDDNDDEDGRHDDGYAAAAPPARERDHLQEVVNEFRREIVRCIEDPEVVGFKSVICYRVGLDLPAKKDASIASAKGALRGILDAHLSGERPFHLHKRLQHAPLNHLIVHLTAHLISESATTTPTAGAGAGAAGAAGRKPNTKPKPFQFHTGLGDNDIVLTRSSPSHMQTFIRQYPAVPIVILHASYPWTREAGYLAAMYANVYADVGEVFPFVSRPGQEAVLRQVLELCPWSKILWSTDGHWFPETYLLATMQVREALRTVLGELVSSRQMSEEQAVQLVQDILFTNAKKLYGLDLSTTLPTFAQLSTASGTGMGKGIVSQKLREMDVKYLRVYWHDYTSTARCRLVPIRQVYRALENGKPFTISLTKATLGLLQTDAMIPGVSATGVYTLHPDWSSLRAGPVDGHASCQGEFREDSADGDSESPLCPRTVLRRIIKRAAAHHQLTFLLGFEIEFVLLLNQQQQRSQPPHADPNDPDDDDEKQQHVEPPAAAAAGVAAHAWSVARTLADWGRPGGVGAAADEALDRLAGAGVEVEQFHAESAPGQFELVLAALPPMEACDTLLHARQILESVAARHGFRMTLHPKPFAAAAAGSASHVHVSIATPGGEQPAVYEPFYAGILGHLRAVAAFTAASPASYERLVDSAWAGGRWVTWGTQNREAPLRKVSHGHWEVKTLDGLANPYFACAALLAAGIDGVDRGAQLQLQPHQPHQLHHGGRGWGDCAGADPASLDPGRRDELGIVERLPESLGSALEALRADKDLVELLGEAFVARYVASKEAELKLLETMGEVERRRWIMDRY